VVSTLDKVFVHSIKDLIYFAITEIQEPLDLIPETPVDDIPEPEEFSEEEELDSDFEDMEGNNSREEEREDHFKTTNLGWVETSWPSLDEYTIFPNTQKRCFPSTTLKLQACLKTISRNSYLRSDL
jgi:hypothetical protein